MVGFYAPVVNGREALVVVRPAGFVEEIEGAGGGRSCGVEHAGEIAACDGFDERELCCLVEFVVYGCVGAHVFDEL